MSEKDTGEVTWKPRPKPRNHCVKEPIKITLKGQGGETIMLEEEEGDRLVVFGVSLKQGQQTF